MQLLIKGGVAFQNKINLHNKIIKPEDFLKTILRNDFGPHKLLFFYEIFDNHLKKHSNDLPQQYAVLSNKMAPIR